MIIQPEVHINGTERKDWVRVSSWLQLPRCNSLQGSSPLSNFRAVAKKKIVIIVWKRLAKCSPFQQLIYLQNWVPCIYCRQNDLQWQNEDAKHLSSLVRRYRDLCKCKLVPPFSQNAFVWGNRAVATFENILTTTYVGFPSLLVLFQ